MPIASHEPTHASRVRVASLCQSGITHELICEMMGFSHETLVKYYSYELKTAKADLVDRIAQTVARQAMNGNEKSQALYLKTQGAKYGWVEKQVVETVSSGEADELKTKIAELEAKYNKDY